MILINFNTRGTLSTHVLHRRGEQISGYESSHTNRIGSQRNVSCFSCWIVENSAAVSGGIYIFFARSHIFINDNCTVTQHINLPLKQRCIRTEADAQYHEIRCIFSLIRYHFAYCIFALKSNYLLSESKSNSMILKGALYFVRVLCIQIFA
ncbi:hypothetical protein D3C74_316830 [compost metagenome]